MSGTLITELPPEEASSDNPQVSDANPSFGSAWVEAADLAVCQRPPSPAATSTLKEEENSVSNEIKDDVDDSVTEKPCIFDTWVEAAKKEEAAQQLKRKEQELKEEAEQLKRKEQELRATMNSNSSSNGLSSTGSSQQQNENQQQQGPWRSKRQHNKLGQYKLGQGKGISKVRLVGDPNVEALEIRVAERRAAEKLRDDKIRKKIEAMEAERVRREAELAAAKKAEAEAVRQAKQEEIRRKHEEHLAAEEARKVRCKKLKCDMDVIEGKKSVVARLEDRKAELKKKEEEESRIAKAKRHETCATGKDFYEKLDEHEVTVKTKAEADALDRTKIRKLGRTDMPPLPLEYRNKVRDQFLRQESQRKAELLATTQGTELSMTVSQGKRSNMIQYAKSVQREILPTLHTVPMVVEEEKKTVPRESKDMKERNKEGNMAIHHHPSRSASTSPSTTPQQGYLAPLSTSPSSTPQQPYLGLLSTSPSTTPMQACFAPLSTSPSTTPDQTSLAHSKARSPSSTPSQLSLR